MAGNHTYSGSATEDIWFDLGSINGGYNLASGWSDEDGDEQLYAQLTPVRTARAPGDTIIGAQFQYGGTTVTYSGTPLNIPVSRVRTRCNSSRQPMFPAALSLSRCRPIQSTPIPTQEPRSVTYPVRQR